MQHQLLRVCTNIEDGYVGSNQSNGFSFEMFWYHRTMQLIVTVLSYKFPLSMPYFRLYRTQLLAISNYSAHTWQLSSLILLVLGKWWVCECVCVQECAFVTHTHAKFTRVPPARCAAIWCVTAEKYPPYCFQCLTPSWKTLGGGQLWANLALPSVYNRIFIVKVS